MSNDQPQDKPGDSPLAPPELAHLAFLSQPLPDPRKLSAPEAIQFYRERIADFQKHGPELDRLNFDYRPTLALLEAALAYTEARVRVQMTTQDERLQAMADQADARTNLVKTSGPMIDRLYAAAPHDPQLQETKALVDEMRTTVPKDL
jgi:hypothetical protein